MSIYPPKVTLCNLLFRRNLPVRLGLAVQRSPGRALDEALVAALELAEDLPSEGGGDDGEAHIEADRDVVVGVALRLHGPSNGLAESLYTAQDTDTARQAAHVGSVLADQPVEELLERLACELPPPDKYVMTVEFGGEPVKDGLFGGAVVSMLQHDGGDPGGEEDSADDGEGDHAAVLDVHTLAVAKEVKGFVVEQVADVSVGFFLVIWSFGGSGLCMLVDVPDQEGAEDAAEVGQEGREGTSADSQVGSPAKSALDLFSSPLFALLCHSLCLFLLICCIFTHSHVDTKPL